MRQAPPYSHGESPYYTQSSWNSTLSQPREYAAGREFHDSITAASPTSMRQQMMPEPPPYYRGNLPPGRAVAMGAANGAGVGMSSSPSGFRHPSRAEIDARDRLPVYSNAAAVRTSTANRPPPALPPARHHAMAPSHQPFSAASIGLQTPPSPTAAMFASMHHAPQAPPTMQNPRQPHYQLQQQHQYRQHQPYPDTGPTNAELLGAIQTLARDFDTLRANQDRSLAFSQDSQKQSMDEQRQALAPLHAQLDTLKTDIETHVSLFHAEIKSIGDKSTELYASMLSLQKQIGLLQSQLSDMLAMKTLLEQRVALASAGIAASPPPPGTFNSSASREHRRRKFLAFGSTAADDEGEVQFDPPAVIHADVEDDNDMLFQEPHDQSASTLPARHQMLTDESNFQLEELSPAPSPVCSRLKRSFCSLSSNSNVPVSIVDEDTDLESQCSVTLPILVESKSTSRSSPVPLASTAAGASAAHRNIEPPASAAGCDRSSRAGRNAGQALFALWT